MKPITTLLIGIVALLATGAANARGSSSFVVPTATAIAMTAAINANASEKAAKASNDPLVVICTAAQIEQAYQWQRLCEADTTISCAYCPIISYHKYCTSATRADTAGLNPVKPHYQNVFFSTNGR